MPISFYVKSDNDFLNCVMWMPEKSRDEGIVFCHGWGGGTPYDDLLKTLADRGYTVLRFEQRGYGNSTGHGDLSLWPVDMAACAAVLKGAVKKVWAAGQSTGGTMALVVAATQDCFAGAISLAPFCSCREFSKTIRTRGRFWRPASGRFKRNIFAPPTHWRLSKV